MRTWLTWLAVTLLAALPVAAAEPPPVRLIVKPLLCVCLLESVGPADVTATTGNTLTIAMNASGILTLSGADSD